MDVDGITTAAMMDAVTIHSPLHLTDSANHSDVINSFADGADDRLFTIMLMSLLASISGVF